MSAADRRLPLRGLVIGAGLAIAFIAGFILRGPGPSNAPTRNVHAEQDAVQPSVWTCSMHPQVRLPEPGRCPICDMDLIPEKTEATDARSAPSVWTCSMHPQIQLPDPGRCPMCDMDLIPQKTDAAQGQAERVLELSESARSLARVRTVAVERRPVIVEVRMAGKIDYDETRIRDITSYVPGRLERLYVDYTGVTVNQGDHMVDIYSPELLAAQEELLQAIRARDALADSALAIMRNTSELTVGSAREKLRLWGLLPQQIAEIERRGSSGEAVTLYSPMTGVVIEKHANQGMYVETGSRIYTIADLLHLWARLEAYESDMAWIHLGQEVEFATDAHPGALFKGRISFIGPVVDPKTRTVRLRVNLSNSDLRLKPGMLVRAVVKGQFAGAGRVFDPYLAGKWISPMHPEVVKDGPGECDICGMPLVPAEELGYVSTPSGGEAPLVIPATAPLITGKRAVVYVEDPTADRPTYEGREVTLGPKAGTEYIVNEGLREGERVVVEGNFKIDSALQIQAKPSMMSPPGTAQQPTHEHQH